MALIVDDDPSVARVTHLVFTRAGIAALVATSSAEAAAVWNRHKDEIDLVVSDYNLDCGVTGEQLVQLFSNDKPSLKSIIVSAHPSNRLPGRRTEGVDFFQKPWSPAAITAAARRLLDRPRP
jgi:DNA-binding NtrC family response regulator